MSFNELMWRTAAKQYRCEWCYQSIEKAERHAHFVGKFEGEFQNWRMHRECHAVYMKDWEDGFMPGEGQRPVSDSSNAKEG